MKNKYKIDGDVLIVYNRKDDREILFDAEDFDLVNKHTWYITDTDYAEANGKMINCKRQPKVKAHRLIMNFPKDKLVDHRDGDKTLDNRKSNLFVATIQENQHNRKHAKGYYWNKSKNRWTAQIQLNNKRIYIGHYFLEDEARAAYLKAKAMYHPTAPIHLYK